MKRFLLVSTFAIALLMTSTSICYADTAIEIIDNDFQEILVSVNASKLHVVGANGETLYIYNVAGVCVMSIKVDSTDRYYDLNLSRGCYIVKVGKTVRKISIK
ncbi:MAG: T9SS type A sorting domain-containing protein [Prevotella sp.]|nr:T9SS type A sorting domain-containing protein [Prevotella sp.]